MSTRPRLLALGLALGTIALPATGHDPRHHGGVAWPELSRLDALAERAEALIKAKDADGLRKLVPALAVAAETIAKAPLPRAARNPLAAKLFQDDIGSLAAILARPAETPIDDLTDAAAGLHLLVVELMGAVGMPHVHEGAPPHGPHDGILVALAEAGGKAAGHAEIKLHDDAGDLEVWLFEDEKGQRPLRRPLDTGLRLVVGDRSVRLAVRDRNTNPDEEGRATIHEGVTHYFVAPATAWLKGHVHLKAFLEVGEGPTQLKTAEFELTGHAHAH